MRWAVLVVLLVGCASGGDDADAGRARDGGGGVADGGARDGGRDGGAACDPSSMCDGVCVSLSTDPYNCGACGRTCVVANATAGCVDGQCTIASCDEGWGDCDGALANGCEVESACSEGAVCTTGCGTSGRMSCAMCAATCVPPEDVCNAVDDDCDGTCDQGPIAGCRIGVHRSYGGSIGHFYTTDRGEAASAGLTVETYDYFFLYASGIDGLVPLFRCRKGDGTHLYTTSTSCEELGALEGTLGFMARDARCGATPLHRLHSAGSNDHFYTTSAAERDNAVAMFGYTSQGIVGYVWPTP